MTKRKTIDDLFREGLDGKGLSYDPKFWEAAQAGMPAPANSAVWRKRRRLALLALLFLFSGSVLFWLGYELNGSNTALQTGNTAAVDPSPAQTTQPTPVSSEQRSNEEIPSSPNGGSVVQIPLASESHVGATRTEHITSVIPHLAEPTELQETPDATVEATGVKPRLFEATRLRSRIGLNFGSGKTAQHPASILSANKTAFSYKPNAWAWYLAPEVGVTSIQRDLPGNESDPLKQSEKVLNSSHWGLHLLAKKGHWTFSAGAGNLRVRESHNYTEEQTTWTYDTSVYLVRPYYTETKRGTRVALLERIVDSTSTTSSSVPCPDCETQFRYLRIPVSLQYEVGKGRLLGFGGLGLNYMRIVSAQGSYAQPGAGDGSFTVQESVDLSGMRRNLFLWQAEAGLKYRISQKWNVAGSVRIGASNQSIFETYTHRLSLRQAQLGLEYRLR
ncbi:MAG: outer membrane beta-barrel protein [Flavobacteriales bacterium]|nr:outer membrane beta-barrel protein [Flavobacteriales bacterium]